LGIGVDLLPLEAVIQKIETESDLKEGMTNNKALSRLPVVVSEVFTPAADPTILKINGIVGFVAAPVAFSVSS